MAAAYSIGNDYGESVIKQRNETKAAPLTTMRTTTSPASMTDSRGWVGMASATFFGCMVIAALLIITLQFLAKTYGKYRSIETFCDAVQHQRDNTTMMWGKLRNDGKADNRNKLAKKASKDALDAAPQQPPNAHPTGAREKDTHPQRRHSSNVSTKSQQVQSPASSPRACAGNVAAGQTQRPLSNGTKPDTGQRAQARAERNGTVVPNGKAAGKAVALTTARGHPAFKNVVTGDIMVHEPVCAGAAGRVRQEHEAHAQLVTADEDNKRPIRVIVVSKCYTTKL
ncbi:PREDICTED: uncharacterized protein LOC106815116 isoform X2 [Priapulus caudatus]|nr:PREDICTED: uncharacterized protein LOC106815116 isoform X2 [Priapulus caudatus]